MKFRRSLILSLLAFLALKSVNGQEAIALGDHYYPTPNVAFIEGAGIERFVQPTTSGNPESGLFGCVRNHGSRFHEGIDLSAITRDRRGESVDPVFAFDRGVVRYVNRSASKSSYGQYIVIEHEAIMPGLVTLYAHLRSVPKSIRAGIEVEGGQRIATMGRTAAGYSIPRNRAHLHFEVGLWLGPDFQRWYNKQGFRSRNDHGAYNGMNIVGVDVWALLRAIRSEEVSNIEEFILSEPTAIEVYLRESEVPELLSVNPELMTNLVIPANHAGWKIEFAWYGAPIRWTALESTEFLSAKRVEIVDLREPIENGDACTSLAREGGAGSPTHKLSNLLSRLFL